MKRRLCLACCAALLCLLPFACGALAEEELLPLEETPQLHCVTLMVAETATQLEIAEGEPISQLETPQMEGFTFLHWSVDGGDPTLPYAFETPVTAPLSLIAQFAPLPAPIPEETPAPADTPLPEMPAPTEAPQPAEAETPAPEDTLMPSVVIVSNPETPAPEATIPAAERHAEIIAEAVGAVRAGDTVTLRAILDGYDGLAVTLTWQAQIDGIWQDVPGATGPTHTFTVDGENAHWAWRVAIAVDA